MQVCVRPLALEVVHHKKRSYIFIKIMAVKLLGLLFLGFVLGCVSGQEEEEKCFTDGWLFERKKCPSGYQEALRMEMWGQYKTFCCDPESDMFQAYVKSGASCKMTQCTSGAVGDICTTLADTYVNGGSTKLEFEEILRDPCARSEGGNGQTGLCCVRNSTEGALATTYGAENNEFPHQAKLLLPGHCGGTIYNKRFIITAAHCITGEKTLELEPVSEMKVILGTNIADQEDESYVYRVVRAIPNKEYGRLKGSKESTGQFRFINDIALLELDRDIEFGPKVKSLEIAPKDFDPLKYANNAVIVGWGTTDTLDVSVHLQKANFIIRKDDVCFMDEGPHPAYEDKKNQLLCVGGVLEGKWSPTAGGGDSGGPAICRGPDGRALLCGVTSFGGDDADCLKSQDEENCPPSVYVEVAHFHKWIKDHAGEQNASNHYRPYLYGQPVPKGKYEHQVKITSSDGKPCGGTLIAPDVVITAAQCVLADSKKSRRGVKVTTQKGKSYGVKKAASLPNFKRTGAPVNITRQGHRVRMTDNFYSNDMAILRLDSSVDIPQNKLAELPTSESPPQSGIELSRSRVPSKADQLMLRDFKILDHSDCQNRMNRLAMAGIKDLKVDGNVLCGVEKYSGGSQCDRELGGGLICKGKNGKDVLCGVQIFRLCEWSIPNGFINMGMAKDWVKSAMKQL